MLSSLLLCTTTRRVWKLGQLQSRSFQSIKLNKIPRTKMVCLKRKWRKNCLPKQTLGLTKFCLVLVSRSHTCRLHYWMVWKRVLLSDFAHELRRAKVEVPDIYLILLDVAGVSPTLALNQNAKVKEGKVGYPSKYERREAAKAVHANWCCLWVCAQCSEN